MKRTIVVFSNPFGYGPTGNAIPILRCLLKKIKDAEIIFAGSGLCMEIVSSVPVKKVHLDERSEEHIEKFLNTLENPFVISSQNRFCVEVAKKLKIHCSFIDVLAWFWAKIPQDHLLADEIFWIKFPGIENKIPHNQNNIHLVSGIVGILPNTNTKKRQLMIHIGGAKYPPLNETPYSYLNLIAKWLNMPKSRNNFSNIVFAGGLDAVNYLKQRVINKNVFFASFAREEFIQELSRSIHILTTAGVSSTFESFSLNIPTSFILPLNLSQIALLDILLKNKCASNYLKWDNYVKVNKNLKEMSERDAIAEISVYAKTIDDNNILSKKFIDDFDNMARLIPDNVGQIKLMEYIGESGADEIVDFLIKKWSN